MSDYAVRRCGCADWSPVMSTVGGDVRLRVRAVCVWQESQDRAVFGADTPRTIMCKYRSARVGVRRVRWDAVSNTTPHTQLF